MIYRVNRRKFLRDAGVGAGALILGCYIPDSAYGWTIFHHQFPLNNFATIELDGTIHIIAHRSEMGQGIRSSLAAVMADEMDVPWEKVKVIQADADAYLFGVPFPVNMGPDTPAIVKGEDAQFVDSSRSMAAYFMPMRYFGAGVRLVMLKAAALKWGLTDLSESRAPWNTDDISRLKARDGKVYYGTDSVHYQHLLLHAKKVADKYGAPTQPDIDPILKKKSEWKFIGTDKMPFVDAKDMVTGKAVYGADIERPGMLTAVIERCPVANGWVQSFDDTETRKVAGVKHVTRVLPDAFVKAVGAGGVGAGFIPHDGVAVIAENTWAALQGRRALKVEWNIAGSPGAANAHYDSDDFLKDLKDATEKPPAGTAKTVRRKGDVNAAFAQAADVWEASYYVPHLAQTPMEPPAAVAVFENGQFEVWTPTQGPELTQHYLGMYLLMDPNPVEWFIWNAEELFQAAKDCEVPTLSEFNKRLAALLGIDQATLFKKRNEMKLKIRDNVKVHVTLLGGGFGRKSNPDYAIEAAFLAKQYPGTPIRVQWTREDDVKFSFYNSAAGMYYKAGLDGSGHPTAFLERSAFTSFFATLFPQPSPKNPPAVNDLFVAARKGFHNGGEYPYGSAIERSQGLEDMPFHIDNIHIENCPAESHIRCGWMRSVANIYHAFGTASFADELAVRAKRDSKDYLLELIGKGYVLDTAVLNAEQVACLDNNLFPVDPLMLSIGGNQRRILNGYPPDTRRLRAVVERAAQISGWDEKVRRYKGTNRGLGIAAHRSFLSYAAIVIDVSLNDVPGSDQKALTINDIWGVLDCGMAINRDRVKAQMEGGINYGLSIALFGEITVKKGAVVQNNFDDYPVLRIHHAPKNINVDILDSGNDPTGAGEPPTPAVAPALANAIVAAGGPRIREIPFYKHVKLI
jgi:isoquinoline 1-oxidoreductase beta subunit